MNNPFLVGDVVYHATLGKGRVDTGSADSQYIYATFSTVHDDSQHVEVTHCSFEPWPAPVHKRPLEDGWWVVFACGWPSPLQGKEYTIRRVQNGLVVYDGRSYPLSDYNFITKVEIEK